MKIHIVKEGEEHIVGYRAIVIKDGKIDFEDISDNECTYIIANDIIDCLPREAINDFIKTLLSKLRIGGSISIGGTDLRMFCISVINSLIQEEAASEMIKNVNSMSSGELISTTLKSFGLNITTSQISGIHYEITAQRG